MIRHAWSLLVRNEFDHQVHHGCFEVWSPGNAKAADLHEAGDLAGCMDQEPVSGVLKENLIVGHQKAGNMQSLTLDPQRMGQARFS
ncbi:hypothetical protein EL18_02735 [Nitratireductor basaltis]|uniref:Uncharacterized protein n=1 Tax=Nitratireductor basaltis TaxID=472175 RepID=A0A084U698_9HYPH|nr:hypothetical protein EL18_02735 [Nitratireductor basaltis]